MKKLNWLDKLSKYEFISNMQYFILNASIFWLATFQWPTGPARQPARQLTCLPSGPWAVLPDSYTPVRNIFME